MIEVRPAPDLFMIPTRVSSVETHLRAHTAIPMGFRSPFGMVTEKAVAVPSEFTAVTVMIRPQPVALPRLDGPPSLGISAPCAGILSLRPCRPGRNRNNASRLALKSNID